MTYIEGVLPARHMGPKMHNQPPIIGDTWKRWDSPAILSWGTVATCNIQSSCSRFERCQIRCLPRTEFGTGSWIILNHPESRLARRAVAAFVYGSFSCKHIVTVWWVFVVFVFVNMKFLSDVFDFEFWMKDTMKVELMNEKTWNTWRNMEHTMNNFSKWQKVTQKGGPTGWSVVVIDSDRR